MLCLSKHGSQKLGWSVDLFLIFFFFAMKMHIEQSKWKVHKLAPSSKLCESYWKNLKYILHQFKDVFTFSATIEMDYKPDFVEK